MRPELERLQRIEHQLLHKPQPEQAADWHVQELLDPDLASDTELQRRIYQGLYAAGQQQLRQELATIHQHLYGAHHSSKWTRLVQFLTHLGH